MMDQQKASYIDLRINGDSKMREEKEMRNKTIFDKAKSKLSISLLKRIIITFLIINLAFPLYLAYNTPTSLVKIFDGYYDIDAKQYGNLYSVYALPNIVFVFFGGVLVDTYGANRCSIVFMSILTFSTILTAFSSYVHSYPLLLLSRVLLGLGGETVLVCASTFISEWFNSDDIPFIMGIESSWVQFATVFAFGVLPSVYHNTNSLPFTLNLVAIISCISLFFNIIFVAFQKRLDYRKGDGNHGNLQINTLSNEEKESDGITMGQKEMIEEEEDDDEDEEDEEDGGVEKSSTSSTSYKSKTPSKENMKQGLISNNTNNNNTTDNNSNNTNNNIFTNIINVFKEFKNAIELTKSISARMWVLVIISFFGYSSFYGLDIIVTDMIVEKYGYSDTKASMITAIETLVTGSMGPLFGYAIKRSGKRIWAMGIGVASMSLGLLLFAVTDNMPIPWVLITGLGYGIMNNAIMSSVPVVVNEHVIATSYGLIGTSYNAGIVIYPYVLGACRKHFGNYKVAMFILVCSSWLALSAIVLLKIFDNNLKKKYAFLFKKNKMKKMKKNSQGVDIMVVATGDDDNEGGNGDNAEEDQDVGDDDDNYSISSLPPQLPVITPLDK